MRLKSVLNERFGQFLLVIEAYRALEWLLAGVQSFVLGQVVLVLKFWK